MANTNEKLYGDIQNFYADDTETNTIMFLAERVVSRVNTSIPVKVIACYPDKRRVDVLPLVSFINYNDETITPATLFTLPYMRVQGGIAALVTDPIPGDIGIALFAQKDSSNVTIGTKNPVPPGSFRKYSMSDGFYIGGFLNQTPKIFLELQQSETAILTAKNGITLNVNGGCTINAQSGGCRINGDLTVDGHITVTQGHHSTMNGDITVNGGDVVADGISLQHHVHGGVQGGSGNTGGPK